MGGIEPGDFSRVTRTGNFLVMYFQRMMIFSDTNSPGKIE